MKAPDLGSGHRSDAGQGWPARLHALETVLFRIEQGVCVASMAVVLVAVVATVVVRNLALGLPNFGEYALVAMLPLTFVGGALCTYLGSHIALDLFQNFAGPALRRLAEVAVAAGVLAFAGLYLYSGYFVLAEVWESGERMLDLGTPLAVPIAFVPIGMALMLVHALCNLLRALLPDRFAQTPDRLAQARETP